MYVSIDLETTGCDPENHQILEVGAVIDDLKSPVDELESFCKLIEYDTIVGSPFALNMNKDLIRAISDGGGTALEHAIIHFKSWLIWHLGEEKITFCGKNASGFDLPFLRNNGFLDGTNVSHSVIDPGSMYLEAGDTEVPGMATCLERAGLDPEVRHQALDDAYQNVRLVRHKLGVDND